MESREWDRVNRISLRERLPTWIACCRIVDFATQPAGNSDEGGDAEDRAEASAVNVDAPAPGNVSAEVSGRDCNAGVGRGLSIPVSDQYFTISNIAHDEWYGNEDPLSHYVRLNCTGVMEAHRDAMRQ